MRAPNGRGARHLYLAEGPLRESSTSGGALLAGAAVSAARSKHAGDPQQRVQFDGRYALHGGAFMGDREPPGINDAVEPSDADDGRYGWTVQVAPP